MGQAHTDQNDGDAVAEVDCVGFVSALEPVEVGVDDGVVESGEGEMAQIEADR
jgi:hypothetical protein